MSLTMNAPGQAIEHEGLRLWYGEQDTPAPGGEQPAHGVSLVVGVAPAHPCNAVTIRYRVDGGLFRDLAAVEVLQARRADGQRFRAAFPRLPVGSTVEYHAVLTSVGRQVPPPSAKATELSSFKVVEPASAPRREASPPTDERFAHRLEFVSAVRIRIQPAPQVIGEAPDGLRINYYARDGEAAGPRLTAQVLPGGMDSMIIRRDGVGQVRVRATLRTAQGSLLGAEYDGICDWGEDGYAAVLSGRLPPAVRVQTAPRFFTQDPQYRWMNRGQFLGVGEVRTSELEFSYDLYLVHSQMRTGASQGGQRT